MLQNVSLFKRIFFNIDKFYRKRESPNNTNHKQRYVRGIEIVVQKDPRVCSNNCSNTAVQSRLNVIPVYEVGWVGENINVWRAVVCGMVVRL